MRMPHPEPHLAHSYSEDTQDLEPGSYEIRSVIFGKQVEYILGKMGKVGPRRERGWVD